MNVAAGTRSNIKLFSRGYPVQGGVSFSLVPTNMQIMVHSFSVYNASASSCDMGLGITLVQANVKVLTGAVATAPVVSSGPYQLFDTTAGDGFIIEAPDTFGYVTLQLTQGQTGSPVYTYEYWNGAWVTLSLSQPVNYTAAGKVFIVFNAPADWIKGDGGVGPNTGYAIRVRASTAGTQVVTASSITLARWIAYRKSVTSLGQLQVDFEMRPYVLSNSEALIPYFQTANAGNTVEGSYQQVS